MLSTEPISSSPTHQVAHPPRYLTPLAFAVAVRGTSEAVTSPPKSSRSSASACAVARPSLDEVETLTKPSPSTMPFGSLAGMLPLVDPPPDTPSTAPRGPACRRSRPPRAFAGACAGAADTSVAAATATATTAAEKPNAHLQSVPDGLFAATCL